MPAKGAEVAGGLQAIEHVVVLMLENRSFDHLIGGLPHEWRVARSKPRTCGNGNS